MTQHLPRMLLERSKIADDVTHTPFQIVVFDTSVGSQNLGDVIITNAVRNMLVDLFPQAHLWSLPTHDVFGAAGRKRLKHSVFSIACGTNLLTSDMPAKGLWRVPRSFRPAAVPFGYVRPKNLVLCAVGSNARPLGGGARRFLQQSLWRSVRPSVRDVKTTEILAAAGIAGSMHTSCVTLWKLADDHSDRIPKTKSQNVVVTLTGTRKASRTYVESDKRLLTAAQSLYEVVYFWPQGAFDLEYFLSLGVSGARILPHTLEAYTSCLEQGLDYVGTRLHAGIYAVTRNCRAIIVPTDNRAIDLGASVGLQLLAASEIERLPDLIGGSWETRLVLPRAEIAAWQNALSEAVRQHLSAQLDLTPFLGR